MTMIQLRDHQLCQLIQMIAPMNAMNAFGSPMSMTIQDTTLAVKSTLMMYALLMEIAEYLKTTSAQTMTVT